MQVVRINEHPLQTEIRSRGLRLWEVKTLLGGEPSESHLSRMLRGICPMPEALETKIKSAIENL